MRARKNNRSSSEYCHSYFRRGHPHLLWLIGSQCRRLPLKTERLSKNHALGHNVNKALHDDTQLTQERAQASGNILDGNGPSGFARALDIIRQEQIACTDTMRRLESGSRHLHAMAAEFQELHTRNRNSISAIINHLRHLYDRTPQDHERSPTGAGSNASVILRESGKLSPSSAYLAPSVVCPDRDRSILPQAFRVQSNIQIGTASAANVFAPWKTFSNSGLSRASQYNYIEVGSTNIDSD
jgi:heat shock transcription factor